MQEAKREAGIGHDRESQNSNSDATSKGTVSDLDVPQSGLTSSNLEPGPSPDGAFDESKETGPF